MRFFANQGSEKPRTCTQSSEQGTFTYPLGWHQLDLRLLARCGGDAEARCKPVVEGWHRAS